MVLRPLTLKELKEIFDDTSLDVIRFFIQKSLFSQPESIPNQGILPIQFPKEHLEQWIVQAIGAKPVGAGSYAIDIVKEGLFGADIKMLSCKINKKGDLTSSDSGETSLAQKFKDTGNLLDELFEKKDFNAILDGWKVILYNKLLQAISEQKVPKIYYLFLLRTGTTFKLCGMEVYLDKIKSIEVSTKTSKSSFFVDNFIDSNYGNVKIYKAKKRIELRLKPKYWVDNNLTINFDLNFRNEEVNIRDLFLNDKIESYKKEICKNIFE